VSRLGRDVDEVELMRGWAEASLRRGRGEAVAKPK
jgi:hypothetical protein